MLKNQFISSYLINGMIPGLIQLVMNVTKEIFQFQAQEQQH